VISNVILRPEKRPILHFLPGAALLLIVAVIMGCSGNVSTMRGPSMGTVQVSMSDPPSCMPPNGNFMHVFITVRSVQAHTSATADDNTAGWQELAPNWLPRRCKSICFPNQILLVCWRSLALRACPSGIFNRSDCFFFRIVPQREPLCLLRMRAQGKASTALCWTTVRFTSLYSIARTTPA